VLLETAETQRRPGRRPQLGRRHGLHASGDELASMASTPGYLRISRTVLAWFHSRYLAWSSCACRGETSSKARISGWPIHPLIRASSCGAPSTVVKVCW